MNKSPQVSEFNPLLANCFLQVHQKNLYLGTLEIKLFDDIVPNTARNFRKLCTGEKRLMDFVRPLHYLNTPFHRIVPGKFIQGGDISQGNGRGGASIYGQTFPDENFILKHDRPYLLSMANKGPNTNNSQFFITSQPCPHLDNKHVVFGEVVNGKEIVDYMSEQAVDNQRRPYYSLQITNCGIIKPGVVFENGYVHKLIEESLKQSEIRSRSSN